MHIRDLLIVICMMSIGGILLYGAERQLPLTVTDGHLTTTLYFGLDPTATNGVDLGLGELVMPPLPPAGAFDARFIGSHIGLDLQTGLVKDYRLGTSTSSLVTVHELFYQVGLGNTITIGWVLPNDVSASLQDLISGTIINVHMAGTGSYSITNPGVLSTLKLTVHYRPLTVGVKVLLEGPYNIGQAHMNIALKEGGQLASHFGAMPVPGRAVDSINLEIRNDLTTGGSTIRKFRPAWLMQDGTIRSFVDTALTNVEFDSVDPGNYYIVARHRNHLAVMSAAPTTLSPSAVALYDFTTGTDKYHGGGAKALGGGKFGMFAGNNDGDNLVTVLDYNAVGLGIFTQGYLIADHDMDGLITVLDYNPVGLNIFVMANVP
jgi:hypothetical protein